jgi:hypothetical protein
VLVCLGVYLACAAWFAELAPFWTTPEALPSTPEPWSPLRIFISTSFAWIGSFHAGREGREYSLTGLSCLLLCALLLLALFLLPSPAPAISTAKPDPSLDRLRRRTRASAIACLLLTLLWLRSYNVGDYLGFTTHHTNRDLSSECGALRYEYQTFPEKADIDDYYTAVVNPENYYAIRADGRPDRPQLQWQSGPTFFRWSVPFWPLVFVTLLFPAIWIGRFGLPAWTTTALAGAVALWPIVIGFIHIGRISFENLFGVTLVSACLGAFVIGVRDVMRSTIADRRKPWPWQFRKRRAHYRRQQGLCLECGYDLRGSAGQCPECGAVYDRKRAEITPR